MKVYTKAVYILLTILLFSTAHAVSEEKMEEHKKTTWQMQLQLDVQKLKSEAVLWAVFEEDPFSGYKQRLEAAKDEYNKLFEETDEEDKQIAQGCQMCACWDLGFIKITGDRVYLLTTKLGHSFSSNREVGKKWFVTKAVYLDDKPVCWVIPVEAGIGESVNIKLTEENIYDLSEIYNAVMSK